MNLFYFIITIFVVVLIFIVFSHSQASEYDDLTERFSISYSSMSVTQPICESYVICLSDDLFETAKNNLQKFVPNIQMFEAINGYNDINYFDNKLISIAGYKSIFYDVKRKVHADLGSLGAVGCALSHYNLWQKATPNSGVCIYESDAVLLADPTPFIKDFLLNCPNPHILLFGGFNKPMTTNLAVYELRKMDRGFLGFQSYYITYEGAQILSKYFFPIETQVDSYISNLILIRKFTGIEINVWIIEPGICYQYNPYGTTIQSKPTICNI